MSTYLLLTPSEDELYHHGIKGQKWGIRRFQPYLPGSKVKGGKEVGKATKVKQRGGIVEHFKAKQAAHKKSAAVKKAQATRKANTDFEAAKKKAIESGTAEDLAKFKGKLTNEEYSRVFMRLQYEKKLADMVAANQKSVWDTIDSGMKIVERVGKYAGTIATAKENFSKMDEALHKKENDDKKAAKEAAKRIKGEEELREDYNKRQAEANKPPEPDHTVRNNAAYDNSDPKDFEKPKKAYEKTPSSIRDKAAYKNPDGESGGAIGIRGQKWIVKENVDSGKRVISGFKSGTDKPVSYNSVQTLRFGESTVRRLTTSAPKASQVIQDMRKTVASTQAESARQKEVDKKRKARLG